MGKAAAAEASFRAAAAFPMAPTYRAPRSRTQTPRDSDHEADWNDPTDAGIESGEWCTTTRTTIRRRRLMRTMTLRGRTLLRRLDSWTRWAFNPQPELTSRYDRG